MAARRCYRTKEAIVFILEPGSDSEMSDLKNSDDETGESYIPPERENESDCDKVSDESYSCRNIDQNKDNKNDNDKNSNTEKLSDRRNGDKSTDSSTGASVAKKLSEPKIKKKYPDHKWRWRLKEPPTGNTEFRRNQFSNPPFNFYEIPPIDFFKLFWTEHITHALLEQTNLYIIQEQGKNINTCVKEIEQFLCIY